ncbi:CRISPR system Cascade subunit CasE [Actinoalloteichus hoggarensis]|uniref:CRISPR-associated endoribonuclease Cse3 n=1 Tax=Actinoalloteichus hoggarensis TaxID=1470176 RepID=A0A221W7L8_9PSEU|nr:type I-E CRISPR-associated protein Cas6/Cse3/CasE [Actinoalloteichus hoggarensis]ASO21626.1 CRISPR-associated endoribonuclease Cse3 [Actinoalloteichus hoggarensis]MBB5922219.1 CRISPR system Cascade subunit CasE [Actinoalloteichus hoggarensis]
MTLWLTQIKPDMRLRQARRDLASAVGMHHRLLSLFPDDLGDDPRRHLGVLFRVETSATGAEILLQSQVPPDLHALPEHYGSATTRNLDPLVEGLRPGRAVHYRIAGNAIRRLGKTTRAARNLTAVLPLHGAEAEEWWHRHAEASGLQVQTVLTTPLGSARGERADSADKIRHARTLFDGRALITDADLLRRRLLDGIGRGKAYGCGLLTLAPAR